jgi:uncharacterized protein
VRTRQLVRVIVVTLVLVQVVVPLCLALFRNRLIYYPYATPRPEEGLAQLAQHRAVDARLVHVVRPDGRRLAAYDVRPRGAGPDLPVVLFLHGNAGNIALRAPLVARFAEVTGARVLMPDYSGFGGNPGRPSEGELRADALAAYEHLVREGVPGGRVVLFGESVGGAPALWLATQREVAGVVVQSGFASLSSMALRVYPWMPLAALLVRGTYANVARVAEVTAPVLLVHGADDRITPVSESRKLLAAAPPGTELLEVPDADHNDMFAVGGRAYLEALGERFRRWTSP